MRLLAAILLATLPASAAAVDRQGSKPLKSESADCPQTAADRARANTKRPMPRKLGELPPATEYKAVWRHLDRCEIPLTAVEYRRGSRSQSSRP